jgi:hypothetical protein
VIPPIDRRLLPVSTLAPIHSIDGGHHAGKDAGAAAAVFAGERAGGALGGEGNEYVVNLQQQELNSSTELLSLKITERLISKGAAPNQTIIVSFNHPPGDVSFEIVCQGGL